MALKLVRAIVALILILAPAQVYGQQGNVGQGLPAPTTDAAAWPVKIVYGGGQIDPRSIVFSSPQHIVCDSGCSGGGAVDQGTGGSSAWKVTFGGSGQPVTQSGAWTFSFTAPQHIICDSGCGSPPATADNSAFTFGTTSVSPIGYVVDDVATNAVAENSFGAPRMTANRVTYADLSQSASNTNSFKVDFGGAAQPISAASLPLPTGAATSALQTTGNTSVGNIDTKTPALGQALAAASVPVVLTAAQLTTLTPLATVAVTGTFWQATQPVSAASLPLPTGAATAAAQATGNVFLSNIDTSTALISQTVGSFGSTAPTIAALAGATNGTSGNTSRLTTQTVDPGASDEGLVVRNLPSGTQAVSNASLTTLATMTTTSSGTLTTTPTSGVRILSVQGYSVATVVITGTWTGTIQIYCELPSSNAVSCPVFNLVTGTVNNPAVVATTTVNGLFMVDLAGVDNFVVNTAAGLASGTATIGLEAMKGPPTKFPWGNQPVKITDGTNNATIKAASTAAVASDPSVVVSLSPNNSATVVGPAATNAAPTGNPVLIAVETVASGNNPTAATGGNQRRILGTQEGAIHVQEGNGNRFSCFVQAATVTTQCQASPPSGLRLYITSLSISNQAATVQTVDVVYGTGAACVTGTTALTHKFQMGTNATTTSPSVITVSFPTPLIPATANAVCVRPSAATAFGVTITGYIAP